MCKACLLSGFNSRSRSVCSQEGTDKFIKELYVHATQSQTLRSLAAVTPPLPPRRCFSSSHLMLLASKQVCTHGGARGPCVHGH